jgi:hypothetical protein
MVVAHHPRAKQTGQMRVYFPKALRERVVQKDGWVVLEEGNAWLGVKVLSGKRNTTEKNYRFEDGGKNGDWLWPKDVKPPVAFVVSRVGEHKTLDDFLAYLRSHGHGIINGRASYTFVDEAGEATRLELELKKLAVPLVNGKPVDLQPEKVFSCPFMNSVHGSGVVDIRKGERTMRLDFSKTVTTDWRPTSWMQVTASGRAGSATLCR